MALLKYLIKRIIATIPTLIGVSVIVFFLVHIIPGDPAEVMLGEKATEAAKIALQQRLGLDKPLHIQYWNWLTHAVRGDFGISIRTYDPVTSEIMSRLPATMELSLAAIIVSIVFGIIFGVTAARYRNTAPDQFLMGFSLLGVSVPVFWLGLMMIYVFAVKIGGLPVSGRLTMGVTIPDYTGLYLVDSLLSGNFIYFIDSFKHLIMPTLAVATINLAVFTRFTRSSMLDVLSEDYVRTARAKGVSMNTVIYKHALKNAMIPLMTIAGLQFASLLGGAILTETVFAWPGVGRLLITAISNRDYPLIQGIVMFISFIFILVNIIVDVLYAYVDPRIRFE